MLEHVSDHDLQEYLDGDRRAEIRTHLKSCPKCRAALKAYQQLYASLADEKEFTLPDDFAASVVARVGLKSEARRRRPIHGLLAASLILAIAGATYVFADLSSLAGVLGSRLVSVTGLFGSLPFDLRKTLSGLGLDPALLAASLLILLLFGLLDRAAIALRRRKAMFMV